MKNINIDLTTSKFPHNTKVKIDGKEIIGSITKIEIIISADDIPRVVYYTIPKSLKIKGKASVKKIVEK